MTTRLPVRVTAMLLGWPLKGHFLDDLARLAGRTTSSVLSASLLI